MAAWSNCSSWCKRIRAGKCIVVDSLDVHEHCFLLFFCMRCFRCARAHYRPEFSDPRFFTIFLYHLPFRVINRLIRDVKFVGKKTLQIVATSIPFLSIPPDMLPYMQRSILASRIMINLQKEETENDHRRQHRIDRCKHSRTECIQSDEQHG